MTFETDAGQTYQIVMNASPETDPLVADLIFTPSPTNDYFSNRVVLAGSSFTVNTPIVGARLEPGEPTHSPYFGPRSVWYTWTAPASGNVTASSQFSGGTAVVEVYTGDTLSTLTQIPTSWNPMIFHVDAGVNYQIAVGEFYGNTDDLHVDFNLSPDATAAVYRLSMSVQPSVALRIALEGEQIKVAWPASATGILESTTDLTSPDSWQPVQAEVMVKGDESTVTLPHAPEGMFFRLHGE